MSYLFSSESVCAGHPDKICDQISDAIVDAALTSDKRSRVAVETLVTTNQAVLAGEVTSGARLDYGGIAQKVIRNLGYINPAWGFSDTSEILVKIHEQSSDIAIGVDEGGAGDQGLCFGYACQQTPELMPLPIMLAHGLTQRMDEAAKQYSWLRPDGKAQVTVEYRHRRPIAINTVVLARPHDPAISLEEVKHLLFTEVVRPVMEVYGYDVSEHKLIVNGTGKWEIGGPASDTGVTGRKIIVDTYGGWSRHGGGCFSGKDATKVDRSAAYAARWAAKNVVAQRLASECEIQVTYVIGKDEPVSVMIETFGTEMKPLTTITDFVKHLTSFRVSELIDALELRKPQFFQTATYGHFGKPAFSWEAIG